MQPWMAFEGQEVGLTVEFPARLYCGYVLCTVPPTAVWVFILHTESVVLQRVHTGMVISLGSCYALQRPRN